MIYIHKFTLLQLNIRGYIIQSKFFKFLLSFVCDTFFFAISTNIATKHIFRHLMAAKPDGYSQKLAYKLGTKFQNEIQNADDKTQWYLSAKLCFILPTIKFHPHYNSELVNKQKLILLQKVKQEYKIIFTAKYQCKIPNDVLCILKSFYYPWLIDIKHTLKERGTKHIELRKNGLIQVFKQVLGDIHKYPLNVEFIKNRFLQEHLTYITNWNGPYFRDLKIRNDKEQNQCLTVLNDYDGYKKRCNNSQEEFTKKYEGKFIAVFIFNVLNLINVTRRVKIQFILVLLQKEIQFKATRKTFLVPNSWIFDCRHNDILKQLTEFIGKNETKFKNKSGLKENRKTLINIFQNEFNEYKNKQHKNDVEMKENDNNIPPSISPIHSISNVEMKMDNNNNSHNFQNTNPHEYQPIANGSYMVVHNQQTNYNLYGDNINQNISVNSQDQRQYIDGLWRQLKFDKNQLQQQVQQLQNDKQQLLRQLNQQSQTLYYNIPAPYNQQIIQSQFQQTPHQQQQQQ
eukprot:52985_1